jgi:hypothetical protein
MDVSLTHSRADLQHNLFTITFDNKLGLAPPNDADSDVKNVLDIGTGTGIWATDFGDEHPGAKVSSVTLKSSTGDCPVLTKPGHRRRPFPYPVQLVSHQLPRRHVQADSC